MFEFDERKYPVSYSLIPSPPPRPLIEVSASGVVTVYPHPDLDGSAAANDVDGVPDAVRHELAAARGLLASQVGLWREIRRLRVKAGEPEFGPSPTTPSTSPV